MIVVKDPCKICHKSVKKRQKGIACDNCKEWVHAKCNGIDNSTCDNLQEDAMPWFCRICIESSIPFSKLADIDFGLTQTGKEPNSSFNSPELTDCPKHLKDLFKNLNTVNSAINCKYFDVSDLNQLKNKKDLSSYLHLNIASLPSHIDELRNLIVDIDIDIDVFGISESALNQSDSNHTNVDINGYVIEHTPSEARKGGALLYINSNNSYKTRKDLNIYKSKELESVFIEIINKREKNTIVGCIYRHPSMSVTEFNNDYLMNLLEKINLEHKNIVLMGDYNINLLNYDNSPDTSQFLNSMCSYSLFPTITQPTRVTPKSRTLIDNVFINFHSPDVISGNITISISDHLAQFICIPTRKKTEKPEKVTKRCYKNFEKEKFIQDISAINWNELISESNVNNSISIFLKLFESVLDNHAPSKLMTNKEVKIKNKPWITSGILKSIKIKDFTHKKYLQAKNIETKNNLFIKFKSYRNSVSNLLKLSKKTTTQTILTTISIILRILGRE